MKRESGVWVGLGVFFSPSSMRGEKMGNQQVYTAVAI